MATTLVIAGAVFLVLIALVVIATLAAEGPAAAVMAGLGVAVSGLLAVAGSVLEVMAMIFGVVTELVVLILGLLGELLGGL